jgi:pimeloyl-ACP methyl ester carboxylesterase
MCCARVASNSGALRAAFAGVAFALAALPARAADRPPIVTEDAMVPAPDAGLQLFVRNKHPADLTEFSAQRTVLFVHGATYPAETTFDLKLGGFSWMDYIAERGFDVYLVDLPGYGKSTRPPEMDQPPDKNPPLVNTEMAVRDVGAVVDMILAKRHIAQLNLIGWSWGTTIMATYTERNNAKVERLVLYAPVWIAEVPSPFKGAIGAYRTVTKEAALARWLTGVPEDKKNGLIPDGWFERWANATWATDPASGKQTPSLLRAPNGVLEDFKDIWFNGKSTYDPAKITVPVLLIQAEWDADTPPYMARELFSLLTNTPFKRYVLIGEGTHTVIMEKNRLQLFREVQEFLFERPPKISGDAR